MTQSREIYTRSPRELSYIIESLQNFPQAPVDNNIVAQALQDGLISKEQQRILADLYTVSYNKALRACFPRDAFGHLDGVRLVASAIENDDTYNLEQEALDIQKILQLPKALDELCVKDIYLNFLRRTIKEFPYEEAVKKLSRYINECLRRSAATKESLWLTRAIKGFRVLGYVHKLKEDAHYSCESEYDEMVRYGIDRDTLQFIRLPLSQLTENTYDNMRKPTIIKLKDPNYD